MKKKKWMKRIISLFTALCLCVALMPAAAAAESTAPTNVRWDAEQPGLLRWDAVEGDPYGYGVLFSMNGEPFFFEGTYDTFFDLSTTELVMEEGVYTAEVFPVFIGENGQELEGDAGLSDAFIYTPPEAALAVPANPRWDGTTARWDAVAGTDVRYRVVICIDDNGEYAVVGTTLTDATSTDLLADMLREFDNLSESSIFFTVRAISSNILTCQGSQLTEFIPYGASGGGGSGELAAPVNVRWDAANPGFLKWDAAEGAESYRVEVSLDGEFIWGDYTSSTSYAFAQRYLWLESGTYTATVASVAWEDNGQRITSDPVSGGSFVYAAPAAQMETPGNPRWDGTTAVWDAVAGTDVQYRFTLYAHFGGEYWEEVAFTMGPGTENDLLDYEMSWLLEEGATAFAFDVAAISPDITVCRNSEPSAFVEYEGGGSGGFTVPVTGIFLGYGDTEEVGLGQRYVPSVTLEPSNATNQNFTITSSNPAVAVVERDEYYDWLIRFVGTGTVTITATAEDGGHTDSCVFTVRNILPQSLTLKNGFAGETLDSTLSLFAGDTFDLGADLEPYNITNDNVVWTVSDTSVCSIETLNDSAHSATLTALAPGTATVTAACEADKDVSDSITVTVTEFGEVSVAPLWGGLWSDYCAEDFSGYNPAISRSAITIWSAEELALLSEISWDTDKRQLSGYTIKLGCDIYLGGRYWVPGGDALSSVTFDGNGHTIYGLTVSSDELRKAGYGYIDSLGLFGSDSDLKVQNLQLKDAVIIGEDVAYAGTIAGKCSSLTNCKTLHSTILVKNSDEYGSGTVGGLAGKAGSMENCRADFGSMVVEGCKAGGLAGVVRTATLCTNNMDITARSSSVGGLFGEADGDLDQCINEGDITVYASRAAGVARSFGGDSMRDATMRTCFNKGVITASGNGGSSRIAGLVVYCDSYGIIKNCSNLADLTAETNGSSAAGIVSDLGGKVLSCKAEGNISADYVAGIACEVEYGTVMSCRNNAVLEGEQVGGIAYRVGANGTVDGCENTAAIESDGYAVGGIAFENQGLVNACVNYGSVTAGHAGGIVYTNAGTIKGCGNYNSVRATDDYHTAAGGIAAEISNYRSGELGRVEGCENHGSVTSANGYAGGIVGSVSAYQPDTTVIFCRNSGTVSGEDIGGIVGGGFASGSGTLVIDQCENTGTIRATGDRLPIAGGILGYFGLLDSTDSMPLRLTDVHNDGVIKSTGEGYALGGIAGGLWLDTAAWPLANAFSSGSVITGTDINPAGGLVGYCVFADSAASALSYYRRSGSLDAVGGRGGHIEATAPGTMGLTAAEMANASSFETFDFTGIWEMAEHPRLRMEGLESARESGAGYYTEISDRLFRIVVPGNTDYPGPSGFTVQSGTTTRHSGGGADVNFPLQADSKDPIVFSKDGYHTYEMPRKLALRYNVVTMIPDSVKTPFVQSVLLEKVYGNGSRSYENLRSGIISVYTMNVADAANYEGESVYVDVDWNGHEEGSIWLEQNGVRIPLADGTFTTVEMGKQFKVGSPVYVCIGEENGVIHRTRTTVQIVENPAQLKAKFDVGEIVDPTANPLDKNGDMDVLAGSKFSIDFKPLEDKLKLSFEIADDGTIKGIMGIKMQDADPNDINSIYKQLDEMKDAFFDTSFAKTPAGQKLIQKFKNDPRIQQSAANFGIKGDGKFLIMLAARLTPEGEIEWTDVSFLFAMEGEASTYFTSVVPTPLGAVPTVTSFGLKLDAQTGLEMGMDPESSALRISLGKLDTVLKFYARYGVGLNDDLAVQPFGSGGVHVVQPFGSVPALAPVGMTLSAILEAGLHVAYGFGEFDWVWTDIPEYYFWKDYRFCWEKVSKNATVQLVQRQISGDYSADFVSLMNMESEAEVFKSSVSPIAQPQLAVLEDGTRILAWLDYENTRGTADGCAVYYSVCRNGIWSDPVLLDDDGTADASLVMEELNGTVFLAWMDRDCTFGDAYPQTEGEDDFLTDLLSADISVARFDTATGTFTDITVFGAPDTMDSMPVLAAAEGGVALGWRSANETCLSNLAENGFGDFRFAVYQKNDEGTAEQWSQVWTREELPAWYTEEELPADAEEIASYLGSGFAYAAQGDLQAAVFPMEDEESGGYGLYGSFQDGTGWGEPILLADLEESTAIAAISADFAPDGALNIAAASRALNSDGSRSDETELLTLCCDPANDVALLEVDYDRDTLIPGGNLALELYVRNLGPRQANAFRVTVLREGEQLVQEAVYSPVASGAESILSVSCPLPAEEDWGDLSALTVVADPISWEDGDQTNNLEVCSLYLTDVSIEKVYATESMDNQTGKNTTTVSAWVVNRGRDPLTDVTLTLYGDLNRETALATTTISKTMAPGTAELCTMVTDDLSAGDYAVVGAAVTGEENITSNNFDFGTVLGMKLPGMLEIDLHNARRESGRVLADVSIENPGEVEQQVTLIAAAYQGDRMLQALPLGSFTVAGQSILTKTAELGSITGSAKLVLFTLRADGSYTPVAQSVSTSVK